MSADTRPPAAQPDREAIQASIREAAQRAQELVRHAEAARAALNEAAQKVEELEREAAGAQKTVGRFQEQEREVARVIGGARKAADEIIQSAETRAEEIVEGANVRAADEVIKSAKARAEELAAAARSSADESLKSATARAAEMAAAAKSSADEIVRSARATATDLLQKARDTAQEQLQAAERTAAERRALERSRPAAEEDGAEAEETRKAAEEYLTGVIAKLDAFIHDRDGVSQGLEAAAKHYADSLDTLGRLTTEVRREILPAVDQLLRRMKGGTDAAADAGAPDEAEDDTGRLVPLVSPHERAKPERPAAPRERPAPTPVSGGHQSGEIVVSPVHSFLQATKFITALSQIQGVNSVKLKSYGGATLTLDVLTAGYPVTAIDCLQIDGFAVEVVEAEGNRLVLRLLGSPATRQVSR